MASERRKPYRKLSGGILKSRTLDTGADHRENQGVKIYIRNNDNNEVLPPEIDEERFEHLKDMYYKQCQPINMNLIRKLTEKRTASNYNYYDSAQCSRVLGSSMGGSSTGASSGISNISSMAQRSHRDVALGRRDVKGSNTDRVGKINSRDRCCPKCHGRHF